MVVIRFLLFLSFMVNISDSCADIAIIDTLTSAKSQLLINQIKSNCFLCDQVYVYNLQGKGNNGRRIVNEVKRLKSIKVVVAIGWPAASLSANKIPDDIPLLYVIPNISPKLSGRKNAFTISTTLSYITQAKVLRDLFPEAKSIALMYGDKHPKNEINQFESSVTTAGFDPVLLVVNAEKEIPHVLSMAITQADIVFFIRDRQVINRESIIYIVQKTLESRKPAFIYSKNLVDYGILGAIEPDLLGGHIGKVIDENLKSEKTEWSVSQQNNYKIYINSSSLKRMNNPIVNNKIIFL